MLIGTVVSEGCPVVAVLLEAGLAVRTRAARVNHATDGGMVADFMLGDLGSNFGYAADNLVARDARVDRILPLIARLVNVGVTDATKEDLNLDIGLP
jgi:hypothetical protein